MTDEAKALVERLRTKYCCSDWDKGCNCEASADLIETQAREIARLRESVKQLNEGWDAMGVKGQAIIDRLRAENDRLRAGIADAIGEIEMGAPLTGNDILRAALEGRQ